MELRLREIVYPSNLLSISRIVFVIPIVYLMRRPAGTADGAILLLVVVASLTDYLDGLVARKLGHVGDLGRVIDPLADKVAMGIVGIAMVVYRQLPVPIVVILVYRDLLIVAGAAAVARKISTPPEANIWGKLNTIVCALAAVSFLFAPAAIATRVLLLACYGLVGISGVIYYRLLERRIADQAGLKWTMRIVTLALTAGVIAFLSRWPFV